MRTINILVLLGILLLVLPVMADTLIIYPSVDGYAYEDTDAVFSTMRSDTGDGSSSTTTTTRAQVSATTTTDIFDIIRRTIFIFNTSDIDDTATIISAKLVTNGTEEYNTFSVPASVVITDGTTASYTSITTSDYSRAGLIEQGDRMNMTVFGVGIYNNFTITNLSYINKSGYTIYFLRTDWDYDNSPPPWSSGKTQAYGIGMYDNTDSLKRPYLEIVYSIPTPTPTPTPTTAPPTTTPTTAPPQVSPINWSFIDLVPGNLFNAFISFLSGFILVLFWIFLILVVFLLVLKLSGR